MRLMTSMIGFLLLSCSLLADTMPVVTFTLSPADGKLSGSPGDTVGWGFTLTTNSDFILIDAFNFEDLTPVGMFTAFAPPFAAASSGSPLSDPFDNLGGTGIGSYHIGAFPNAASTTGRISATYDVWDADPNVNASAHDLFSGLQVFATDANGKIVSASIEVTGGGAGSVVPEPTTLPLLCLAAALLLFHNQIRRRLSSRNRGDSEFSGCNGC
jgi:hypothetical protein